MPPISIEVPTNRIRIRATIGFVNPMTSSSNAAMRVLYVRNLIAPSDLGGNRYPFEVVRRLAARGHDVRAVTASALALPSVSLSRYPVSNRAPLLTFASHAILGRLATARTLRVWAADVIVLSSYDNAFGFFWPRRLAPDVPTVFIYHSRFHSDAVNRVLAARDPLRKALAAPLKRFARAVQRTPLERCDECIAVSEFSKQEILSVAPRARATVVSTGVDTDRFSPGDRASARQALGIREDERMLLTVGRLVPVKRYDRAIRALAVLRHAADVSWRLHIVGAGAEAASLRSIAREQDLEEHVRFEGQLDGEALVRRFRAADMQLCTSDFENWSLSILEGLACGLPVVTTPTGGTPDLLRPIDATLVSPGVEPTQIAAAAASVLSRTDLADLRRRCRERALEHSWDNVVTRLEGELARVTGRAALGDD